MHRGERQAGDDGKELVAEDHKDISDCKIMGV